MQIIVSKPTKVNKYLLYFHENRYYLIMFLLMLIGTFLGAASVESIYNTYGTLIKTWFQTFFTFRSQSSFYKVFLNIFLSELTYLLIILISSFGLCGFFVTPFVVFFKGFGACFLAGVLYRNYSFQGIAFANLILLPACLITDFVIIYFSSKGLQLSFTFVSLMRDLSSKGVDLRPECIKLLKAGLLCFIIIVVSAVVETIFSVYFINYFNFL